MNSAPSESDRFETQPDTPGLAPVLPRTEQKAAEQALAKKGSKAWLSDDAKGRSVNLQGRKGSLKQNSFGALKLIWAPLLTRGKLRVVPLSKGFPGGTAEGVATRATKLLPALKKRFLGSPLPKVVFADRGLGSFHPNGAITAECTRPPCDTPCKSFLSQNHCAGRAPGHLAPTLHPPCTRVQIRVQRPLVSNKALEGRNLAPVRIGAL